MGVVVAGLSETFADRELKTPKCNFSQNISALIPVKMMTSLSEPEWMSKPVTERLAHAYLHGLHADVELSVPFMGKRRSFKAHKNILSLHSTAFERLFYGDATGGDQLSSIHPQGFDYVLRLMYNAPNTLNGKEDKVIVLTAYHAAKTLGMKCIEDILRERVFSHIINASSLAAKDFWKLLELSRILKLDDVVQELLKYAESHTGEILKADSFITASVITAKQVFSLDTVNISELQVLESIAIWIKANRNMPFADDFAKDLLSCVRFRNLSRQEFQMFKAKGSDVISAEDVTSISSYLRDPLSSSLPVWCSRKFRYLSSSIYPSKEKENTSICTEKAVFKLSDMLSKEKFTDVCFVITRTKGGTPQMRIKAHRNILALGSYVFGRMFFGPLPDKREVIEITTTFPQGFETMIKYFYDDSNPDSLFTSSRLASMAFDVAHKYGSTRLKTTCMEYLKGDVVKPDTFWKDLEYRRQPATKTDQAILNDYLSYAALYTKDIFESPNFLNASKLAIIEVLKLNTLNMKEIELLDYLAKWVKHVPERSFQFKYDLLRYMRFSDITYEEFISFLARHEGFLSKKESFSILLYLHDKKAKPPKWCTSSRSRNYLQTAGN